MVESLCTGGFENKTVDEAMTFLNEIANKTQQWENNREPQKKILLSRGNVNRVEGSYESDAKIAAIAKRLD